MKPKINHPINGYRTYIDKKVDGSLRTIKHPVKDI